MAVKEAFKTRYEAGKHKGETDFITVKTGAGFINLTEDEYLKHIKLKRSMKNDKVHHKNV